MKKITFLLAFICVCSILFAQPKKRVDSFFGIHFDFHANTNNTEIGKTFTAEMIDSFLTIVKPDYVQVDCKGHPGYSSYPTQVGNQTGGYTQDILKLWREVTAKHNVALFVHYSGLWDTKAMTDHPEWAMINADGQPDKQKAAYFGDYLDKLMIPQLKEISDYGVDGAWVDGECWATKLDYSPELLAEFKRETGIANVPKLKGDPNYQEFVEFNRTAFKRFVEKYVSVIHKYNPNFQITSNWAYSSMMPEPVEIDVDYLSGDVAGQNCVYNAAYQARCMALQGKPWDLMSWGFTYDFDVSLGGPKSLVQLEQEAAEVMSMGGGYQCYWTQNEDGSLKPNYFHLMGELGDFCRAREQFCKGAKTIPQIGLWYSTHSQRTATDRVFGWNIKHLEGNLSVLMDGQNSVEILLDHYLKENIEKYPLIVIPEWTNFDTQLKAQVLEYVKNGGNLLVIGAAGVKEFEPQLGITFKGEPQEKHLYFGTGTQLTANKALIQECSPNAGTETVGQVYSTDDTRFATGTPFASIAQLGKGKIGAVYMDMGNSYFNYQASGYVNAINEVIGRLFPNPIVKIKGSAYVHATLSEKDGNWLVHIINASGNHFNQKVYEYGSIPGTGELQLEVDTPRKIIKAILQPEGKVLKAEQRKGKTLISVPSVSVHSMVQLGF